MVDSILLATVGKIFKLTLRSNAAKQKILDPVRNALQIVYAEINVAKDDPRFSCLTFSIPEGNHSDINAVENALVTLLFEAKL